MDIVPAGSTHDIKWRDVRVGHILKVEDEELFPADLLCMFSALEDQACFIKTTNLDGESNLKIRRPLDLRDAAPEEEADVLDLTATLECEQPNANLHKFQGRLMYQSGNEGTSHASQFCQSLTVSISALRGFLFPTSPLPTVSASGQHHCEPWHGSLQGDKCGVAVQRRACL